MSSGTTLATLALILFANVIGQVSSTDDDDDAPEFDYTLEELLASPPAVIEYFAKIENEADSFFPSCGRSKGGACGRLITQFDGIRYFYAENHVLDEKSNVTNAGDCCRVCRVDLSCCSWVLNKKNNKCFALRFENYPEVKDKNYISGLVN